MCRRRPRLAYLRQPHPRYPMPLVRILAIFPWAAIRVAVIEFSDGYRTEVEAALLAPL